MLCPLNCHPCDDPECRDAGCRVTGHPMLELCWVCGEVATISSRTVVCVRCLEERPPVSPRQRRRDKGLRR